MRYPCSISVARLCLHGEQLMCVSAITMQREEEKKFLFKFEQNCKSNTSDYAITST